ncbi:hypothetical protein DRJ22_03885 [Candidatus Woesearchaeota archaeon]|nr:MAG: hypothetical protein DRJ22_03885 [Candidatus Woesearchaeota archaeon]
MKKPVLFFLIILLLAISVYGEVYHQGRYYTGKAKPGERIICDIFNNGNANKLVPGTACCITKLDRCFNNDPLVGYCPVSTYNCLWPTQTFKPSFSYAGLYIGCASNELGIITGYEYYDYLKKLGCRGTTRFFCCPKKAIVPTKMPLIGGFFASEIKPAKSPTKKSIKISTENIIETIPLTVKEPAKEKNAIYVIDKQKWLAAKLGISKDPYVIKAYNYEKFRCAIGGGDINRKPTQITGVLSDTRNIREGERVFMFANGKVIPLVTWCEK